MVAGRDESKGSPAPHRYANFRFSHHSQLALGVVVHAPQMRHTMTHSSGHPDQFNTLTIIRNALRAAVVVPTYQDALDITGEALCCLAQLARVGARHAA
jgi:hypothetical protein